MDKSSQGEAGTADETAGGETVGGSGTGESGDTGGPDPREELCGKASLWDEFELGLSKNGTSSTLTLVGAVPFPAVRDFNVWTLRLDDAQGQPIEGVEWEVFPWMPDHGHGTPTPWTVSSGPGPGEYVFDPLDLFMAGRWTIDFTASWSGGEPEVFQFSFCIE